MFRFALEPLLEMRKRIEDAACASFERARRGRAAACAEVAALEDELRRCAGAGGSGALLGAVASALDARVRLAGAAQAALDEARALLIAASRDRKVVELLRERQRAAYDAERRRHEQRDLDEANARAGTTAYGPWQRASSPTTSSRWRPSD